MSPKVTEKKFSIKQVALAIGISSTGVRSLLDNKKLGYYQSGARRIIGESHLHTYLSLLERNHTKSEID